MVIGAFADLLKDETSVQSRAHTANARLRDLRDLRDRMKEGGKFQSGALQLTNGVAPILFKISKVALVL